MQEAILQTVEPQLAESQIAYPGWKIVLAGFFGLMVSFAAIVPYTFGLFLKPLAQSFGWHREATSVGFSIAALTLAAASPGLGFLLDRYKPRRIILPCIVVFSAAYASLALLTPRLLHFYLTFFLIGLVGNGTAYIGYSRAISTWFNRRRGFALSIMLAGSAVGAMLLPVLAQAVITHLGWRTAYLVLGLLAFHRTGRTRCQGPQDSSLLDHCGNGLPLCHQRQRSHRAPLRPAHRPRGFRCRRGLLGCSDRSHQLSRTPPHRHLFRPLLWPPRLADNAPHDCARDRTAVGGQ